jgi:hypothetical protein
MELIDALWEKASTQCYVQVIQWCDDQKTLAFTSVNTPTTADIPILISAVREKGVTFLADVYVS